MKSAILFLIVQLTLSTLLFSQTYHEMVDSAFTLAKKNRVDEAIETLRRASTQHPDRKMSCYYNIACVASRGAKYDMAFVFLDTVIHSSDWRSFRYTTDPDLSALHADTRWKTFLEIYNSRTAQYEDALTHRINKARSIQETFAKNEERLLRGSEKLSARALYDFLHKLRNSPMTGSQRHFSFFHRLDSTDEEAYFVALPERFQPDKDYPLIVTLHGAVRFTEIPRLADSSAVLDYYDKPYFENAFRKNAISVYLFANKKYNWMFNDAAFMMVPDVVAQMKQYFNIDDSRVYIVGHSNGSTGAFNYAVRYPDPFAGFGAFNNYPRVFTGGTFIKNAVNRPFYNISTDKDYYYPLEGHIALEQFAVDNHIPWKNVTYQSFPHWFPSLAESEPAYVKMYDELLTYRRDPFHKDIYWECDDVKFGKCDWIEISKLDTAAENSPWHQQINYNVGHWIDPNNFDRVIDSTTTAFSFPRISGALVASYANNTFTIQASRVKELKVYISPDMVNLDKSVTIKVNGKVLFSGKVTFDKEFLLKQYQRNRDRQALWVNVITVGK